MSIVEGAEQNKAKRHGVALRNQGKAANTNTWSARHVPEVFDVGESRDGSVQERQDL